MNRQLRHRHRWMTGVLALVALLVLAIALRARRSVPASAIPPVLRTASP
jgi:hypothetical protein